jgi:hypothetical protein
MLSSDHNDSLSIPRPALSQHPVIHCFLYVALFVAAGSRTSGITVSAII